MKFKELVTLTSNMPCFSTSFLGAGKSLPQVRLQLDRWEKKGKVMKVAKSIYSLSPPYLSVRPNPFAISSILRPSSYISLQTALSFYGLIPEYTPSITAITTGRPWQVQSASGRYVFRHIKDSLFWGYQQQTIDDQTYFIASPEKALLDLIYITAGADQPAFIESLRLQNLDKLNAYTLDTTAERMNSKKVFRAVNSISSMMNNDEGFEL
ncbi:MAG: hypothetical protein PF904_15650 [Kiritimatiellae bacterium]|jgi:predicted transcriptional regulator of viral defense system|nr:hypothetical protein [Kiritimatiellia bacterium]